MGRLIFGWDYPPGAASDPAAPYNQVDPPCAVCGQFESKCICPACPVCGAVGDPNCYDVGAGYDGPHGLTRSPEQVASLAKAKVEWDAAASALSAELSANSPEED